MAFNHVGVKKTKVPVNRANGYDQTSVFCVVVFPIIMHYIKYIHIMHYYT